jgi:hypothetical protein
MSYRLLIVVGKLIVDKLVDVLPQFNSALGGIVPAVPPREIVTYKLLRPRLRGVVVTVYKALESDLL